MPKIAIVTGGNQGLGWELVRGLCRVLRGDGKSGASGGEGGSRTSASGGDARGGGARGGEGDAVVYLTARDRGRGEAAVASLNHEGLQPRLEIVDVRDTARVEEFAKAVADRHGGVDVVLSNAAARRPGGVPDAEIIRTFVDTNNHGTLRMINAFGPLLNDGARFVVVASMFGSLRYLPEHLRGRFDVAKMSLRDVGDVMDAYARLVETGRAAEEGWPESINIASKIGQVAAIKIMAREWEQEARRRDILINAACPGLLDTEASRPWFDDMSSALTPEQGAVDVLWLATLPAGTRHPYGELVQHRKVVPFDAAGPPQ
jgi:NAD(P)-dependent dehydrogenase (short-subunit alcohol dehydrogenase family)